LVAALLPEQMHMFSSPTYISIEQCRALIE